jgi:hypothetical protein
MSTYIGKIMQMITEEPEQTPFKLDALPDSMF